MSVDHEAYFGIGAQVRLVNLKERECPYEYISNKLIDEDKYVYFETGARSYGGEGEWFIVLKNNKVDYGLIDRLVELVRFINSHPDFKMIGEAGLVGGSLIS